MLRKGNWLAILVVALVAVLAVTGCGKKDFPAPQQGSSQQSGNQQQSGGSGTITAAGSTALQPLVDEAAKQYMEKNPGARIVVNGGGSGNGLSQVFQGAVQIGNSDIFAEEKDGIDASQLVDHKVAVVGMAVIVNPDVKVDNLTQQQLIDIFTGKITNWKDVGGPDQKINIVNRPKGSGTRATFKKYALNGAEEAQGIAMEQDASGTVRKTIAETPGAIGYLALSYIDSSVRPLKIDGVEPTAANIVDNKYKVWAYEHMYTKGQPTGEVKKFLDFIMSDDVQKNLVTKMGYIPVTDMKVERDAQGNVTPKK
ncbi:MAG: phosphate transport system substrate-binding protein [Moorella sp. (in: firmicutes)]|nr:phosphate transport system substrate-binding protein [Moorella sp. (in: firmicutes)]